MGGRATVEAIEEFVRTDGAWTLADGKLMREWRFGDFAEAMRFVNRVAATAEEADHHPDIDIRYDRVRLALISHDVGGISGRDLKMARRLSAEFPGVAGKAGNG